MQSVRGFTMLEVLLYTALTAVVAAISYAAIRPSSELARLELVYQEAKIIHEYAERARLNRRVTSTAADGYHIYQASALLSAGSSISDLESRLDGETVPIRTNSFGNPFTVEIQQFVVTVSTVVPGNRVGFKYADSATYDEDADTTELSFNRRPTVDTKSMANKLFYEEPIR